MGRLSGRALPSRLRSTSSPARPSSKGGTEACRLAKRDESKPWRAWYKTARWQKLRLAILKRDGWTCQRTGVLLVGKYPAPNSAVVNHKQAHRGNERLFWDAANLEAMSKEYHDREQQRLEASGLL